MAAKSSGASSPIPTRERILSYLQENRTATAAGLSRAWGLTRADVRYHLSLLQEEGLVELVQRDPNQALKRGRPTQTYRLAAKSAPNNLPNLCAALLGVWLNAPSPDEQEARLRAVAEALAKSYFSGNLEAHRRNPVQQLNRVVAFLNQQAYRARWEAHASGPRLLLRSCPYAALLKAHPELCEIDRRMLEVVLQSRVEQAARMNTETGKPPACIFTIGESFS